MKPVGRIVASLAFVVVAVVGGPLSVLQATGQGEIVAAGAMLLIDIPMFCGVLHGPISKIGMLSPIAATSAKPPTEVLCREVGTRAGDHDGHGYSHDRPSNLRGRSGSRHQNKRLPVDNGIYGICLRVVYGGWCGGRTQSIGESDLTVFLPICFHDLQGHSQPMSGL